MGVEGTEALAVNLRLVLGVIGVIRYYLLRCGRFGAEWILKEKLEINRHVKRKTSERHPSGDDTWAGG